MGIATTEALRDGGEGMFQVEVIFRHAAKWLKGCQMNGL